MLSYWDILPNDLQMLVKDHKAAIRIQECAFKLFYRRYGPKWKAIIKISVTINDMSLHAWDVYDMDYWCYLNNIMDPWYDYSDDPDYQYY